MRYFGGLNTSCEEIGAQNSYDKGIIKLVSLCVHSCQICFRKDAPGVDGGLADDSMSLSKLLLLLDFFFADYRWG